jgi:hypothetical protein
MSLTSKYAYAMFVSDAMTARVGGETFCLSKRGELQGVNNRDAERERERTNEELLGSTCWQ